MHRARLGVLFIGFVCALAGARGALADDPTLYVKYTASCTFTVTGDNGATISTIPPGNYQVLVTSPQPFAEPDLSGITDPTVDCGGSLSFHLTGPGVNLHTTLDDGDSAADQLQATLAAGSYTAVEDRRPTLRTVFTVAAGAATTGGGGLPATSSSPTATKTPTKPDVNTDLVGSKVAGTLSGGVDTRGRLTLTYKGKPVGSLKAGRYRITVLDETSKSGFTIQKLGKAATSVTTKPYLGKRSVTLTLKAGQWFYYSPAKQKIGFIVHA
jgi:hypothetical protein